MSSTVSQHTGCFFLSSLSVVGVIDPPCKGGISTVHTHTYTQSSPHHTTLFGFSVPQNKAIFHSLLLLFFVIIFRKLIFFRLLYSHWTLPNPQKKKKKEKQENKQKMMSWRVTRQSFLIGSTLSRKIWKTNLLILPDVVCPL